MDKLIAHILVVDDDDGIRTLVKKYLNENNFIVKDPDIRTFVISEHTNKDVRQPIWKKIYRVNSYTESINEGIALDIGLRIILGGSTSILYDSLVNEKKIYNYKGKTIGKLPSCKRSSRSSESDFSIRA